MISTICGKFICFISVSNQNTQSMRRELIFIIFIFFIAGCEIDPVDMNKIEFYVESRLYEAELNKIEECKQKAMTDAEAHVDSIIADITRKSIFNDMFFPERPVRDTTEDLYNVELEDISIKSLLDSMRNAD